MDQIDPLLVNDLKKAIAAEADKLSAVGVEGDALIDQTVAIVAKRYKVAAGLRLRQLAKSVIG